MSVHWFFPVGGIILLFSILTISIIIPVLFSIGVLQFPVIRIKIIPAPPTTLEMKMGCLCLKENSPEHVTITPTFTIPIDNLTFSVNPTLPSKFEFDTRSGSITAKGPFDLQNPISYTLIAVSPAGMSVTAKFHIEIIRDPPEV